jgi:hypothetical protein
VNQNLKLVAIMHVDRSSLQQAAVLRLPLPSSDTLTRLVYIQQRNEKFERDKKGKYDEEMAVCGGRKSR